MLGIPSERGGCGGSGAVGLAGCGGSGALDDRRSWPQRRPGPEPL